MFTLPPEFSKQISEFSSIFSKKVFEHAKVLLLGSLLVVGRRTVCSALRAVGMSEDKRFHKYHRVLSRSKWSCYKASNILLKMLVKYFFNGHENLTFGIDETIERRWGAKIKARGIYRDAVRSSKSHFVKCSGLRWICMMLLTPISWADRIWALPFLSVLAPSERYYKQKGKKHKKMTDMARQMILQLSRWLPDHLITIVADSSYSVFTLLNAVSPYVTMISPLRLDAALYDFVPPRPKGKIGRNRKKGERLIGLEQILNDPSTKWTEIIIPKWYDKENVKMLICSACCIWYKGGEPPVKIRWVLLKDPSGKIKSRALLCTDLDLEPKKIINEFIKRWTVEVTFEQVRAHLGVETQRQWSDKAIARTTPILMALFSIITIWADQLNVKGFIHIKPSAWYLKEQPCFSDAIAAVRQQIWRNNKFLTSVFKGDDNNLKTKLLRHLVFMATRAA